MWVFFVCEVKDKMIVYRIEYRWGYLIGRRMDREESYGEVYIYEYCIGWINKDVE